MSILLGIDYGTKKVGIARADVVSGIATPVAVISRKELLSFVLDAAEKEGVTGVVIGESTTFDMQDNPVMKEAREFAKILTEKGLEVIFENEFMSSMQASRIQGYNKAQDASAAAIILQTHLDRRKHQDGA